MCMCLHIQNDHLGQPDTKNEDRSAFMDDYATHCASMVSRPQKQWIQYTIFLLENVCNVFYLAVAWPAFRSDV